MNIIMNLKGKCDGVSWIHWLRTGTSGGFMWETGVPYKARNFLSSWYFLKKGPALWNGVSDVANTDWTATIYYRVTAWRLRPPRQVTNRTFLKKPTAAQEVNKFPILRGTGTFITVWTTAHHWTPSWLSINHSTVWHLKATLFLCLIMHQFRKAYGEVEV
jgi:hypothetical protein